MKSIAGLYVLIKFLVEDGLSKISLFIGYSQCSYNISCERFIIIYLIFVFTLIGYAIYKFTKYKNKKKAAFEVGGASLWISPVILVIGSIIPQINYFLPKGDMGWVILLSFCFIGAFLSRMGGKIKEE